MTELLDEFGVGTAAERAESWRYSQSALRALSQVAFEREQTSAVLSDALSTRIRAFKEPRVVFVNGILSREFSAFDESNIHVSDSIEISAQVRLHLVFVGVAADKPQRWQRDISVRADADTSIVEHQFGEGGPDVLGAVTSHCIVKSGAVLDWTTIVDVTDSHSLVRRQTADVAGTLRTTHALAGGRLQRFDIGCDLNHANARYKGRGVLMPSSRQHIDVQLDVQHRARDTSSDVLWRGIADGRGRGILRGAITVAQGADGADAQLQTKNLLLSPHAEIDAQPVLEIYADEVKASHGATVGQLDERHLFYLRSRGIPVAEARDLLIAGFVREALDRDDGRFDAWLSDHAKGTPAP
ncbi:MAG TPA: SufD family Fe-S cluster assembly protein [Rudaea sp.]|jgi:Fe-S cluster assembly protein SufD|nr:SufD family Fe-S cluster assembly protein [Rudaea sp.]